jgi:hypothetical protein
MHLKPLKKNAAYSRWSNHADALAVKRMGSRLLAAPVKHFRKATGATTATTATTALNPSETPEPDQTPEAQTHHFFSSFLLFFFFSSFLF